MTAINLVTGGTGFVGAHVVRALLARDDGSAVRCLVRATSDLSNLDGLDVELVEGDLCRPSSLTPALDDCTSLYHCAADYRLWTRDPNELYRANVDGTRHLLTAAREAGVQRTVYTSSVGALGLLPGDGVADETTPVQLERMVGHYKRSKFLAEREAEKAARAGLHVVIVNPSTPVGELDRKPTPTGQIIVDFLRGRMPAYVDTGLNLIDVHDVAAGHLLAAERGTSGEKYILGHRNMTLKQILDQLAGISGRPRVRVRLPHAIPLVAAAFATAWARLTRSEPAISLESTRMARSKMYFDGSRAVRELDLPQSPIEAALERAVRFYRDQGYA